METYCAHLHNSIYLSPTGDARPCCRYRESLNLSWNENTDDIINSPQYNELRNKADNGIPLDGCQKCYAEDRAGIESIRSRVNKKFPKPKNKLEYLEISFNNICNLKCVGCEPKYSNLWGRDLEVPNPEVYNNASLPKDLSDLKFLTFFGGEPFATSEHQNFLEGIVEQGYASNISVQYTTNCTLMPSTDWLDVVSKFKDCTVICSIDGIGSVNEDIRQNSKWNKVLKVFSFFKSIDVRLVVNSVVMQNNIHHLKDFAEWINQQDIDEWRCNVLTWPEHLRIDKLPSTDKQELYDIISNINCPDKNNILEYLV